MNLKNKTTLVVCDLRSYSQIEKAARQIKNVDVLVNNAGIIAYQSLEKMISKTLK